MLTHHALPQVRRASEREVILDNASPGARLRDGSAETFRSRRSVQQVHGSSETFSSSYTVRQVLGTGRGPSALD